MSNYSLSEEYDVIVRIQRLLSFQSICGVTDRLSILGTMTSHSVEWSCRPNPAIAFMSDLVECIGMVADGEVNFPEHFWNSVGEEEKCQ
jgi:hypothetical protein